MNRVTLRLAGFRLGLPCYVMEIRHCVHVAFWLVFLAICNAASAENPASIRIELRPFVKTSNANVLLGDIANLSSGDLATLRRFMSLNLGRAPRRGASVVLARDEIERWVRVRGGVLSSQIAWAGPASTEIQSDEYRFPGEKIEATAREALQMWLAQHAIRAEIASAGGLRDVRLPDGEVRLKARPLPLQANPSKRMLVWVDVWVDDRFIRAMPVNFHVSAYASVWVAKQSHASGSVLEPDALELREVDIAGLEQGRATLAGRVSLNQSALPGASKDAKTDSAPPVRLRRPVMAGDVISVANAETVPPVVRGGRALLQTRSGAITLESRVEVLQDGQLGQLVRVKSSNATSPVLARVTGPGKVEIEQ